MAFSSRIQILISGLAKRGDIFAKAANGTTTAKDNILLGSWAKRGNLFAQMERLGAGATAKAKAVVKTLAKNGDAVAKGLSKPIGLTLTPSAASPQVYSTVVTFTAAGSGKDSSASYKYRFKLDGVVVQAWGATATYAIANNLAVGAHTITADVSTETTVSAPENSVTVNYYIDRPAATGVTLTPDAASPQAAGTPITFTALGSGSTGGYKYQFSVDAVVVQAWSTTATYLLPDTTAAGTYAVKVDVTTANVPTTSQADATESYTLS